MVCSSSSALDCKISVGLRIVHTADDWSQNLHFVFLELCSRPDEAAAIRQEISSQPNLDYDIVSRNPMLDSFMTEAVRLNPLDKSKSQLFEIAFRAQGWHKCLSAERLSSPTNFPMAAPMCLLAV